jgi:hypothetical protein
MLPTYFLRKNSQEVLSFDVHLKFWVRSVSALKLKAALLKWSRLTILVKDMLCVGRQRCGGAVCKVNGASSYSLGSLSDITYDPNSDALRVRYVEVSVKRM